MNRAHVALAFALLTFTSTAFAEDAIEASGALQDLQQAVERLETRVVALETHTAAQWSCSANCGGYRGSELNWRGVTGTGDTAAAAFNAMDEACTDFIFLQPSGSRGLLLTPTLAEACVRN